MHLCLCDFQLRAVTRFTKICMYCLVWFPTCNYTFKLKKTNPVLIFLIHTEKVTCQVYNPMSLHRLSSLSTSFLLPSRPAHCSRHSDFLRATIANLKKKSSMDNSQTCTVVERIKKWTPLYLSAASKIIRILSFMFYILSLLFLDRYAGM